VLFLSQPLAILDVAASQQSPRIIARNGIVNGGMYIFNQPLLMLDLERICKKFRHYLNEVVARLTS
jgi:hypothetical protein